MALLPTLILSGCSSIKVRLGMRLQIAKVPVSSLDASMPKDPAGVAPGEKSPLVVKFTQPDGKVLVTEGLGKGKVLWKDLTVTPTIVSVDKKGVVSTPHDPREDRRQDRACDDHRPQPSGSQGGAGHSIAV